MNGVVSSFSSINRGLVNEHNQYIAKTFLLLKFFRRLVSLFGMKYVNLIVVSLRYHFQKNYTFWLHFLVSAVFSVGHGVDSGCEAG